MRSYWLEDALGAESGGEAPRLEGDERADVCIVGGGYTGLWTAINLKQHEPSLDVALVEADICGAGASSRNAGFLVNLWPKFATLETLCGAEEALRLGHASAAAVGDILDFGAAHGIDLQHQPVGWLWAATCEAQAGHWSAFLDALERHQVYPYERLGAAAIAERTGSRAFIGGVLDASAGTIQPGRLVRGLRRVALEKGVRIFERSPMTRLGRGRPPVVLTGRGRVRAAKVVLALYAWSLGLPELRPSLAVIGTDSVVTEPIPERLDGLGWTGGPAMTDGRTFVHFLRTTADGRIVFGKSGGALPFGGRLGPGFETPKRGVAQLRHEVLAEAFPSLADAPIQASWAGPIDRTKLGLPFFGALATCPDVFYGFGYSGNGVLPSVLGGRILASLALGRDDEWSNAGLVRPLHRGFPPEPFRYVGGHMVRAAVHRKDRLENEGRWIDPITQGFAALAPSGFKPA